MTDQLKGAYLEVAERSLEAARAAQTSSVQEKACFLSYHALESLGGALSASSKRTYPRHHTRKLNQFVVLAKGRSYATTVAFLASALASLRNRSLYPQEQPGGSVLRPKDVISATTSDKLLRRVSGLSRVMQKDLK